LAFLPQRGICTELAAIAAQRSDPMELLFTLWEVRLPVTAATRDARADGERGTSAANCDWENPQ